MVYQKVVMFIQVFLYSVPLWTIFLQVFLYSVPLRTVFLQKGEEWGFACSQTQQYSWNQLENSLL